MQEFTRIIGSIYHTGISSANCLFFELFIEAREGTIKERDKGE